MLNIELNLHIYSLDAIKRALYFVDPCAIIDNLTDNKVLITVKKDIKEDDLRQQLLDAQLQIDMEKEFKSIRNMLVAQALEPYQNIDDLLE